MDALQAKKAELEKRLVGVILQEVGKETINLNQAKEMTSFWLAKVGSLTSEEELLNLVKEMAVKWPIFDGVVLVEQGNIQKDEEVKVADDVTSLIKNGKIEEALGLAKATNN